MRARWGVVACSKDACSKKEISHFLHCEQPPEAHACRFLSRVDRPSGTVARFHHEQEVFEGKSMTALKSSKSPQKPGNYFSLGSARWSHSVRKVLQRAFPLQVGVQIVGHFFSIDFAVSSFLGAKGREMDCASTWSDLKLPKSLCWNSKAAACATEWLQTLRRVSPCIYLKLPGRMTALQINTLFSAWGERGKLALLWLRWCSIEWWHLPELCSLARFRGGICSPQEN